MPALIFDCDGVLADTERFGHLPAFNQMFAEFGVSRAVVGGRVRRPAADRRRQGADGVDPDAGLRRAKPDCRRLRDEQADLVARWHRRKTEIYTEMREVGSMPPRPGVRRLSEQAADAGWQLAVASTSAEESVRSVLVHAVGDRWPAASASSPATSCRARSPPRTSTCSRSTQLGVEPAQVIVVEDSRNGMLAALDAGLTCLVTTSSYTQNEDFTGAALVVSSLGEPDDVVRRRGPGRGPVRTRTTCSPLPSSTSATLEALLQRTPRPLNSKDRVHEH